MRRLALCAAIVALSMAPGAAAQMRVCDGRLRHVVCHWQGGDKLIATVPPDEILTYGPTTLSFTDRGRIRIVVGNCEIDCAGVTP